MSELRPALARVREAYGSSPHLEVPAAVFRARFDRELVDEATWLDYCRALASGETSSKLAHDEDRYDRVEFVLTRLLTRELDDGQLEPQSEDEFVRVLAAVGAVHDADGLAERRQKAVGFFADAAERLAGFTGVAELFGSGFVVDLGTYRSGLGPTRLDPAVLYASILVEVSLANHLARLSSAPAQATSEAAGDPIGQADEPDEAQLRRRLAGAAAAVEVFRGLGISDPRLLDAANEADALSAHTDELADPKPETQRRLETLEALALAIDDDIDPVQFRPALDADGASVEALVRYGAFLAAHEGGSARCVRVEQVAVHLLAEPTDDGLLVARNQEAFVEVISRLSPRPLADQAQRAAAAAFFLDAAEKLPRYSLEGADPDELFDGGLYLNLLGYRRALGWLALDPGILSASVLLDVALSNHLLVCLKSRGLPPERLVTRAAEEERKVADIFAEAAELEEHGEELFDTQLSRYITALRRVDKSIDFSKVRDVTEAEKSLDRTARRRVGRAAVLLVLLLIAVVPLGNLLFRDENTLRPMGAARLEQLSSMLSDGHLSRGKGPRVFLGHVDEAAWKLATPEQRRQAAEELAKNLADIDVRAAIVQRGDRLAIQIDAGRVVAVQ